MTGIYVIPDTPNAAATVGLGPGQAPQLAAYYHEANEGEDIGAVLARVGGQYPAGSVLKVFSADDAEVFSITVGVTPMSG